MSEHKDDQEKTHRERATQDVTQQTWCITFTKTQNFKLKSSLIHLFPTFRGHENEDLYKFVKDFHVVCSWMKPHVITENHIKLRAFLLSVQDATKEWIYDISSGSIVAWNELAKLFLERYFPKAKVSNLRREILAFKQGQ